MGHRDPALAPETNRSWEFIAARRLDNVWTAEGALYHIRTDHIITSQQPAPGLLTYVNQCRYITRGAELAANGAFPSGLALRASATYQETHDDATGRIVADAPRTLLKFNASAPLGPDWLRASAELFYVGHRTDIDGAPVDDYLTANLSLRAASLWDRWDFSLTVFNAADTRWTDPKNSGQIPAAPRAFLFRASCEF